MNFFEQGKKDLTQETEMEILQKQKHEQVFIGSTKKVPGHTMFSFNTVTKEIKIASWVEYDDVSAELNKGNTVSYATRIYMTATQDKDGIIA